ncbi:MAG TPA: efflux RND transporter periplasmic adaptor subunit [Gemmatimonadaceae bacterium]|nr:efflux RND transporter periplasmic adaptor subunit [Gemmatimonadaceae bacterium]
MNHRAIILVVPFSLLALGALWGAAGYRASGSGLPPLHTVVADRGNVSQRVVAHGTLQPLQTVLVGSQVSGIVDAIHVDFNSPVRRGQLLAQIDSSTFAAAVRSATAELDAAEARLELVTLQWRRIQQMREGGVVAPAEVEEVRAELRQAEAQRSVRRHALERAQRELERCTIFAPTDGIVVSRDVDVGQTVAASLSAPVLFVIATNLQRMHIHANVSEADIGVIREGQTVLFQVDAHRGREFTGEVVQVRNAPVTVDNVVHYETIIAVQNPDLLLKPGMTAEVSVITAEVQGATRVRNTALRARLPDAIRPPEPAGEGASNGRVYLLRNGELVATPVRTGLSDGLHTEIVSGVAVGDTLVVGLALREDGDGDGANLLRGNQARF